MSKAVHGHWSFTIFFCDGLLLLLLLLLLLPFFGPPLLLLLGRMAAVAECGLLLHME